MRNGGGGQIVLPGSELKSDLKGVSNIPMKEWNATFQPHVTIQMPLNKVIDVSLALFEDNPEVRKCLEKSLPLYGWRHTHIGGLMFLHHLTITSMNFDETFRANDITGTFEGVPELANLLENMDYNAYEEKTCLYHLHIVKKLNELGEIDAKANLPIMSRRPFSIMFNEIEKNEGNPLLSDPDSRDALNKAGTYANLFNEQYSMTISYCPFYGRQFMDKQGKPIDASKMFTEELGMKLPHIGPWLAKKGVITPYMIKFLKNPYVLALPPEVDEVISSVQSPKPELFIDINSTGSDFVMSEGGAYDRLSPPLLMSTKSTERRDIDSMGSYKGKYDIENYGGAIVEYRGIRYRQNDGNFLSKKDNLQADAKSMFEFIAKHLNIK